MSSRSRTNSEISIESIDISKPIIIKMKKFRKRQRDQYCDKRRVFFSYKNKVIH